jgi:Flp pilus assembly protein TadD
VAWRSKENPHGNNGRVLLQSHVTAERDGYDSSPIALVACTTGLLLFPPNSSLYEVSSGVCVMCRQPGRPSYFVVSREIVRAIAVLIAPLWLATSTIGCRSAADFHNVEGVRWFQAGNQQAALQRFQQAVVANPTSPDAHYNLAATLHRIGSQTNNPDTLKQAEAVYNQCLDLNENYVDCRRGLAVLLVETGRENSAFDLMKNWVAHHPELADPQIELARLYEEFGDIEAAKLHLNYAIQADQRATRAWSALGRIREQAGETEQALANYQRSIALNPNQPQVGNRIASLQRTYTPDINISVPTPPGGTRTVTSPAPNRSRY